VAGVQWREERLEGPWEAREARREAGPRSDDGSEEAQHAVLAVQEKGGRQGSEAEKTGRGRGRTRTRRLDMEASGRASVRRAALKADGRMATSLSASIANSHSAPPWFSSRRPLSSPAACSETLSEGTGLSTLCEGPPANQLSMPCTSSALEAVGMCLTCRTAEMTATFSRSSCPGNQPLLSSNSNSVVTFVLVVIVADVNTCVVTSSSLSCPFRRLAFSKT
jgi:hypothetical protein